MPQPPVTFDRPIEATLHVHLADGEEFPATAEHLRKFGLVRDLDAYMVFNDRLHKVLQQAGLVGRDLTDAHLNPLRYLVELAIHMPDLLDHPEFASTEQDIVHIERALAWLARVGSIEVGVDSDGTYKANGEPVLVADRSAEPDRMATMLRERALGMLAVADYLVAFDHDDTLFPAR